jgi:subtilase family serine protease
MKALFRNVAGLAVLLSSAGLGAGLGAGHAAEPIAPDQAVPYPRAQTPAGQDIGSTSARAPSALMTVTLVLPLRDPAGAEALVTRLANKADPMFGKFLTPQQFQTAFGPTPGDVARVSATFSSLGLHVVRTGTTTFHLSGLPADMERAFGVHLHDFQVAAQEGAAAYRFHAPMSRPVIPAAIADLAPSVIGLDSRPTLRPHMMRLPAALRPLSATLGAHPGTTPPDMPGNWTVTDFADYYDVTPLYTAGMTGIGHTLGIVTLASFRPSDAFAYWKSVGLSVSPKRLTQVQIDGGSGPLSDTAGSDETTLDVEQSGGVAPGSNMIVYEAPNSNQGFVDMFARAVHDNLADSVSCSWGQWEIYNGLADAPVSYPAGTTTSSLAALHAILVQAAAQGQSFITAAGDAGAYDVNRLQTPPDYSLALSVDSPASDPAITAAGGTTLPGTLVLGIPGILSVTVKIPAERAWGWDYMLPLCKLLGSDPVSCGILPVGGGGGVSVYFPVPTYQQGLAGVQTSQPDQELLNEDFVPPRVVYALPAGFAGRNVPDVALNADPSTGYLIGYTSSVAGSTYGLVSSGGTSFVAPELNGVTQLLVQQQGKRLGLLNTLLYAASAKTGSPLRPIAAGGNEFYVGRKGYSPAAGLGALDVGAFAASLKK